MASKTKTELSGGAVVYDYTDSYRCCGIQYKQWILTSGLVLCSYVSSDDVDLSYQCWSSNSKYENHWGLRNVNFMETLKNKLVNTKFKVLLNCDTDLGRRTVDCKKTSVSLESLNKRNTNGLLNSCTAYPVTIFRSSLVNQYVADNFSGWQLCASQEHFDGIVPDLIQNLLSVFVILQISDEENLSYSDDELLNCFLKLCKFGQSYHRGLDIIVESSPFAMPHFYNSWSKGIISNNIGYKDCLFFTDTRLVIGCVGAPVYSYKFGEKGGLIGMILNPMLWSQGAWAGFSIGVNLRVILIDVLNLNSAVLRDVTPKEVTSYKLADDLDKAVVLVRCGHNWGSGVVVNKKLGIIITCAHVVNYRERETVFAECGDLKTKAEIIYSSKPGEVFDIAVLKTEPKALLKELPFVYTAPVKGETVYCVGFPMVDTERVTLSKGVIANVVPKVVIQTTCCVQSGASGGAIINVTGGLLGIPVSNMSCATTLALYPHCNLAVPTTSFLDTLLEYFTTNDKSCLSDLSSQNPVAIREWALQHKCKM